MINIVVPLSGTGRPFIEKGYSFPKPLIEIRGKPMIEWVVCNLKPQVVHRFVFIVRKEHIDKYKINSMLQLIAPGCKVVAVENQTQGAACTVLLGKEYIDNEDPLIIANSDQFVDTDMDYFMGSALQSGADAYVMTFKATHPRWSFVKVGRDGFVMQAAEKNPISDDATVGIYYFRRGSDFVNGALQMVLKDVRVNNEFYVCPVFNELILADKRIKTYEIPTGTFTSFGTPEDLENFLKLEKVPERMMV